MQKQFLLFKKKRNQKKKCLRYLGPNICFSSRPEAAGSTRSCRLILCSHSWLPSFSQIDSIVLLVSVQNQYNLARAQQSYKSLVQIHEKNGECCVVASAFAHSASLTLFTDSHPPFPPNTHTHAHKIIKSVKRSIISAGFYCVCAKRASHPQRPAQSGIMSLWQR